MLSVIKEYNETINKMKKELYFERNGIDYYCIGRPADYYYDFGMMPLSNFVCSNILEKVRLVYALYEIFIFSDIESNKYELPISLLNELKIFFNQFTEYDLSHWSLLDFQTLNEFKINDCVWHIDNQNESLVLSTNDLIIHVPKPYENIIGIGPNNLIYQVDESNFKDFKLLSFENDSDFPFLFTSNTQKENNEIKVNNLIENILMIFNKYEIKITSCEDLFLLHNKFIKE